MGSIQIYFVFVLLVCTIPSIECLRPAYSNGVSGCTVMWERKGCYDEAVMDKGPGDENMLINWRHDIKWKKDQFPKFINKLACTCADEAIKANVSAFGLFWWGQCFPITLDDMESLNDVRDGSNNCYKADGTYKKCEKHSEVNCIGNDEAVYIYSMEPIDGKFGTWSSWSACSAECGEGVRRRVRECNTPPPSLGGDDCKGEKMDTETCLLKHCPVNGGFGDWSAWGPCTKDCGGGLRERLRFCDNPHPQYGGALCGGDKSEIETCNNDQCRALTAWTTWSACSQTCGSGMRRRKSICTHNGDPSMCENGIRVEMKQCNTIPCPVHGGWTEWNIWTKCSTTCGPGTRKRSRDCTRPRPSHGGKQCGGTGDEVGKCNEKSCGLTYNIREYEWGAWGEWSECNRRCGNGRQRADRACVKVSRDEEDELRFSIHKRWINFNKWVEKAKKKIKQVANVIKNKATSAAKHVKNKVSSAAKHIKKKLTSAGKYLKNKMKSFHQHMKKKLKKLLSKGVKVVRYAGRLVFRWRKKCNGKSTKTTPCNNHCVYKLDNCKLSNFAQYFYQGIVLRRGNTHPKVIEKLGKEFSVSFRFKANSVTTGTIVQLRAKTENHTDVGERVPLVELLRNSGHKGTLQVQLPVVGDTSKHKGTLQVQLPVVGDTSKHTVWFTNMIKPKVNYFVKISQRKEGKNYFIIASLSGGNEKKSVKLLNPSPKFFRNIHVHATPGWSQEADARITNLLVNGVCTK